jgi:hypothetical protein
MSDLTTEPRYTLRYYMTERHMDGGPPRWYAHIYDRHYCYRPVVRIDWPTGGRMSPAFQHAATAALAELEAEHDAWCAA